MRLSNSSTFKMEVSSRAISFSNTSVRACFVVRVYQPRILDSHRHARAPISVSNRLCPR